MRRASSGRAGGGAGDGARPIRPICRQQCGARIMPAMHTLQAHMWHRLPRHAAGAAPALPALGRAPLISGRRRRPAHFVHQCRTSAAVRLRPRPSGIVWGPGPGCCRPPGGRPEHPHCHSIPALRRCSAVPSIQLGCCWRACRAAWRAPSECCRTTTTAAATAACSPALAGTLTRCSAGPSCTWMGHGVFGRPGRGRGGRCRQKKLGAREKNAFPACLHSLRIAPLPLHRPWP